MKRLKDLEAELLANPKVRAHYDAMEEEFALASALIAARAKAGLSQAQLAKRMGTTQSAIARLESGRFWPSVKTLQRYAAATGCRPRISFEPVRGGRKRALAVSGRPRGTGTGRRAAGSAAAGD